MKQAIRLLGIAGLSCLFVGSALAHSSGQHSFASWIGWIRHFGTSYCV